jgi:hypothetical protein
LDAQTAGALIAAVADVALIIDSDGNIIDRAFGSEELQSELEGAKSWIGLPWLDTVTVESQGKVRALLKDALAGADSRTRHVNHPPVGQAADTGEDVPVLYSALRIGRSKQILASGRDLRTISTLQRRLLDAQASMERDYGKLRQVETRYRLLFQMSPGSSRCRPCSPAAAPRPSRRRRGSGCPIRAATSRCPPSCSARKAPGSSWCACRRRRRRRCR